VVMVAAIGVGHITVSYDQEVATHRAQFHRAAVRDRSYEQPRPIRRGEELGTFHLGSTTIVVFEPGRVDLEGLAAGDSVKMGVGIGWQTSANASSVSGR
jgi:phosphatidylserine decarboxylase